MYFHLLFFISNSKLAPFPADFSGKFLIHGSQFTFAQSFFYIFIGILSVLVGCSIIFYKILNRPSQDCITLALIFLFLSGTSLTLWSVMQSGTSYECLLYQLFLVTSFFQILFLILLINKD